MSEISKSFQFTFEVDRESFYDTENCDTSSFFDGESPSKIESNETTPLNNEIWEVKVKEEHKSIVARCSTSLNPNQLR
jgi:hypothetical protein